MRERESREREREREREKKKGGKRREINREKSHGIHKEKLTTSAGRKPRRAQENKGIKGEVNHQEGIPCGVQSKAHLNNGSLVSTSYQVHFVH